MVYRNPEILGSTITLADSGMRLFAAWSTEAEAEDDEEEVLVEPGYGTLGYGTWVTVAYRILSESDAIPWTVALLPTKDLLPAPSGTIGYRSLGSTTVTSPPFSRSASSPVVPGRSDVLAGRSPLRDSSLQRHKPPLRPIRPEHRKLAKRRLPESRLRPSGASGSCPKRRLRPSGASGSARLDAGSGAR